jgi:hypothetical protein
MDAPARCAFGVDALTDVHVARASYELGTLGGWAGGIPNVVFRPFNVGRVVVPSDPPARRKPAPGCTPEPATNGVNYGAGTAKQTIKMNRGKFDAQRLMPMLVRCHFASCVQSAVHTVLTVF